MSRKKLEKIYYSALEKVKANSIIKDNLSINDSILTIVDKKYNLKKFSNLYIYGIGKAAYAMAKECETILDKKIAGGLVISTTKGDLKYLNHFTSTHPLVSNRSKEAADLLLKDIEKLKKDDLFIFLLSGGASAMVEKPIEGINLKDFRKISKALLTSGIDIKALNSVRKSISQIKGGKLAEHIKAQGEVLVLSDVIGDDINTIGSAPMNNGKFEHHIIGNNKIALKEAKKCIEKEFDKVKIVTTKLDKTTKEASKYISQKIKEYDKKYDSFCLLFAGETTTIVKGDGVGGRNQELALRLLLDNKPNKNISFLCAGSDGIDGNSNATGAFVDKQLYTKLKKSKLDVRKYLKNSDSNSFFKRLGYDFTIGITGTNVMDFIIVLKDKKNG